MNDNHALGLVLSRSEGALLRLLGTVQRRGFEIAGLGGFDGHGVSSCGFVPLECANGG